MKINIKDHFEKAKQQHQEHLAEAARQKKEVGANIALKTAEKLKLEAETKKKESLLLQNEEEGLDVAKLKDKIRELNTQLAQTHDDVVALQKREQESVAIVNKTFEREDLMASVLQNTYQLNEAVVVDGLDQCIAALAVNITQTDAAGRPKKCEIYVASNHVMAVNIKRTSNQVTNIS
jgi:hypothetical protein